LLLRVGFTVAPILFGLDKFFNWTVDWTNYLAPWVNDIVPGSGQDFMYFVGAVEIAAGILVALAPRLGAYVVAAWLAGIVVNLLTVDPPTYYDIALRDFALMLAALTLGRLAQAFHVAPAVSAPRESLRRAAGPAHPRRSPLLATAWGISGAREWRRLNSPGCVACHARSDGSQRSATSLSRHGLGSATLEHATTRDGP
jgi:uncharacterized membrane protein YphA (DoxX/SURF4 family)